MCSPVSLPRRIFYEWPLAEQMRVSPPLFACAHHRPVVKRNLSNWLGRISKTSRATTEDTFSAINKTRLPRVPLRLALSHPPPPPSPAEIRISAPISLTQSVRDAFGHFDSAFVILAEYMSSPLSLRPRRVSIVSPLTAEFSSAFLFSFKYLIISFRFFYKLRCQRLIEFKFSSNDV